MVNVNRMAPTKARQKVQSGAALLVCAYESESLFRRNRLEGGISLQESESLLPSLDQGQEIIFYCA